MTPVAISPIKQLEPVGEVGGWRVSQRRSVASLRLIDMTPMAKVLVKSDANGTYATAHATLFGSVQVLSDGVLEVGCDPGAWLKIGPVGSGRKLVDEANASFSNQTEYLTVIDLTHGRALMRLTGNNAEKLMSKICAIDLSDAAMPNLSAFRSSVAKLVSDVIRNDLADGTRSFLIHCDRSSGQHLFDCILDAGAEFGIDVDGWGN